MKLGKFPSWKGFSSVCLSVMTPSHCLSISLRIFALLPVLGYGEFSCFQHSSLGFAWMCVFISPGVKRLDGKVDRHPFSLTKHCQFSKVDSHQRDRSVPGAPHPRHHLASSIFLIAAILVGGKTQVWKLRLPSAPCHPLRPIQGYPRWKCVRSTTGFLHRLGPLDRFFGSASETLWS